MTLDQTNRGIFLILLGLFKKVGIADSVSVAVNSIYLTSAAVSTGDIVLATFLFGVLFAVHGYVAYEKLFAAMLKHSGDHYYFNQLIGAQTRDWKDQQHCDRQSASV